LNYRKEAVRALHDPGCFFFAAPGSGWSRQARRGDGQLDFARFDDKGAPVPGDAACDEAFSGFEVARAETGPLERLP